MSTTISPRSGREARDDPLDAGHVDLAARPAHDEHLGAAGAVDLDDAAELRRRPSPARRGPRARAEVPAAGLARLLGRLDLEVGAAQPVRRLAVGDLGEAEPPAGAVGDGRRLDDGERPRRPSSMYSVSPTPKRSSGRSVRISIRTWPRSPRRPRTSPTVRRAGRAGASGPGAASPLRLRGSRAGSRSDDLEADRLARTGAASP